MSKNKITIEMIEEYVNNNSKCKLKSKIYEGYDKKIELECECGNTFWVKFNNFKYKNKRQCNECGDEIKKQKFKDKMIPYTEVKKYIESYGCKLITTEDEYLGTKKKLNIKCHCGNDFKVSFDKFKNQNKNRCNDCSKEAIRKSKIKPYNDVKKFIEIESNSGCILLTTEDKYHDTKSSILLQCKCGNKYETTFEMFRMGCKRKCENCMKKEWLQQLSKSHEEFIKDIYHIWGEEFFVLGIYTNNKNKILVRHNSEMCNYYEYETSPSNLLKHCGCPKCKAIKIGKLHTKNSSDFEKEFYRVANNEYDLLSEYVKATIKVKVLHKICEHSYLVSPDNFLRGKRCPICNESKGEAKITLIFINNNITFIPQHTFDDCKNIRLLEFDFYLPVYNTCIEYQGIQHYEPVDFAGKGEEWALQLFQDNQLRDQIKRNYCKVNNIKLIEIPYWEFDNIEDILRKELVI